MTGTRRKRAKAGVALVLALALAGAVQAQSGGFELITPAEAQQAAKAERETPQIRTRQIVVPRPDAPEIQVISPAAEGTTVAAPLRIELAFTPKPGKRIVPSSATVDTGAEHHPAGAGKGVGCELPEPRIDLRKLHAQRREHRWRGTAVADGHRLAARDQVTHAGQPGLAEADDEVVTRLAHVSGSSALPARPARG